MSILTQKKCTKCGEWKDRNEFGLRKEARDGLKSSCKSCNAKAAKGWRERNPELYQQRNRAYAKSWRLNNPAKYKEMARKNYDTHRDARLQKGRQWKAENINEHRANARRWYAEHAEKAKARIWQWIKDHPEKKQEYSRLYRQRHPEQVLEKTRRRRAQIKGNGGTVTAREWKELKEKYNHTCLCCGRRGPEIKLELDHVIPIKLGGTNTIDNAQPLCRSCNAKKHKRHIDYREGR